MGRILPEVIFLLLCLLAVCRAQNRTVDGSGSGSGSGAVEEQLERNCSALQCSHGCNVTEEGVAQCYCPRGYSLGDDMMTCEACAGGMYGIGCSSTCDCGEGNTCNKMTGDCECNACYMGDRCETESDSHQCYVQFLEIADKSIDNLREFYGTTPYPTPPMSRLQALAAEIMGTDNPGLISDVVFDPVSRSDVGQGPLLKLSWMLDRRANPQSAQEALSSLSDKVKLGTLRATYIAQDSGDSTLVTLNAGVKEDPV